MAGVKNKAMKMGRSMAKAKNQSGKGNPFAKKKAGGKMPMAMPFKKGGKVKAC